MACDCYSVFGDGSGTWMSSTLKSARACSIEGTGGYELANGPADSVGSGRC